MYRQSSGVTRRTGASWRRCCALLIAAMIALSIAPATLAGRGADDGSDQVLSMLQSPKFQDALATSKGVNPKLTPIVYLVLDHETLKWSAYQSRPDKCHKPKGQEELPAKVTKDPAATIPGPDGNPRIVRSGDERPVLIVVKTTPFLYSYEGTVSPPQSSPDAAVLQAALNAIGSAGLVLVSDMKTLKESLQKKPRPEVRKKDEDQLVADQQVLDAFTALEVLVKAQGHVQGFVRWLEMGGDRRAERPNLGFVSASAKNGLWALTEFERLAEELPKPLCCYQSWMPLVRLAALPEINPEDLTATRGEMAKIEARSDRRCESIVNQAFQLLAKLPQCSSQEERHRLLREALDDRETAVGIVAASVLPAKKDFIAAAAQLEAFVQLASTQALLSPTSDDWTLPLSGKIAVVAPPFPSQTWLQDNPGSISIKPDASVYPECPRLEPTGVEKKFTFISRRQPLLGYGIGVTAFKSIVDPTFGAVRASPEDAASGLIIGHSTEESHWGTIVAMVFLRARPFFCRNAQPVAFEPGLEFGIGLNSKKTALFLGPSVEFHRFVRLGVGATRQVVTALAEGLNEGMPVPLASDIIRTQSAGKWRIYVGLTFALDALPLFSASK